MKITKYVFRDHFKVSTDRFRKITGLFHDYKDQKLYTTAFPKRINPALLRISDPILVDDENLIYRQNISFSPARNEANALYLNSEFIEESIEAIEGDLVPRRLDLEETETGFIYPVSNPNTNIPSGGSSTGGSGSNGSSPIDYTSPLETVQPPPVTNREVILEAIKSSRHFEDINTITEEVTILRSNFDDSYIDCKGVYNFYVPQYENQIQQNVIPEEVLPNFYVVSLALNRDILNSINQDDYDSSMVLGDTSPYEGLYQKFDKFITLDGNLSLNRNASMGIFFGIALVAYMQQYGQVYDSVAVDYVETVKKRFGHFFNNLSNREILVKLNEFKDSYPMYINIEWSTKTLSPLLVFLQNAGISLAALQTFLGDRLAIKIVENNSSLGRFSIVAQTPILNLNTNQGNFINYTQTLFEYNLGEWITDFLLDMFSYSPIEEPAFNPEMFIIDEHNNQIPVSDQFDVPLNPNMFQILTALSAFPVFKELLREQTRSYKKIIRGDFATSEVILYKVEKRDQNHTLLQTFYVPNVSGIDVQNFVDTQVKYNKTYKYKVFAYTAIYGTEYWYDKQIVVLPPVEPPTQEIDTDPVIPPVIPPVPEPVEPPIPPIIPPIPGPDPDPTDDPGTGAGPGDGPGGDFDPGTDPETGVPGYGSVGSDTIPGTDIEIPTGVPGYGYVFILPDASSQYGYGSDPTEVIDPIPVPIPTYSYGVISDPTTVEDAIDFVFPSKTPLPPIIVPKELWLMSEFAKTSDPNLATANPSLLADSEYRLLKAPLPLNTDYQNLTLRLFETKAEFMMVGGWAVGAHGYPRYTGNNDFDIWVNPTLDNSYKVYAALYSLGVPIKMITPAKIFSVPGVVFQIGEVPNKIDILTAMDAVSFAKCYSRKSLLNLNNIIYPVIEKSDLIRNKLAAGRPKDVLDAAFLSGKLTR